MSTSTTSSSTSVSITSSSVLNMTPQEGSRQYSVLRKLLSNSARFRFTSAKSFGSGTTISDSQLRDDVSRLRRKGWEIETSETRSGRVKYRLTDDAQIDLGRSLIS